MIATLSNVELSANGARQLLGGDQRGNDRLLRRHLQRARHAQYHAGGEDQIAPHPSEAAPHQHDGHEPLQHQCARQHAAPIHAIHQLPGGQRQQQRGQELHQPDHAEIHARAVRSYMPGERHHQHLIRRGAEQPRPQKR